MSALAARVLRDLVLFRLALRRWPVAAVLPDNCPTCGQSLLVGVL